MKGGASVLNKRGDQIKKRVVWCVLLGGIVFNGKAQVAPPIPEPSADAIARAIEAERERRAAELNNPITQIAIQRAQQIQIALQDINLKSQEYRILIENSVDRAQRASTPGQTATFYEEIIRIDYAFRIYVDGKLSGLLDNPTNESRIQALALLDDVLIPAKDAYVKNRLMLAEAAQQRHEYDEAGQVIDMALIILPKNAQLQNFKRFNEQAEAKFKNASPGTDVAARL